MGEDFWAIQCTIVASTSATDVLYGVLLCSTHVRGDSFDQSVACTQVLVRHSLVSYHQWGYLSTLPAGVLLKSYIH